MTELTNGWYYTDPLAAAWMAKHFGMEFVDLENVFEAIDDFVHVIVEHDGPFEVHPDSLHLLEPQVGDLCFFWDSEYDRNDAALVEQIDAHGCRWITDRFDIRECKEGNDSFRSIIQRNGIAFHWPEQSSE